MISTNFKHFLAKYRINELACGTDWLCRGIDQGDLNVELSENSNNQSQRISAGETEISIWTTEQQPTKFFVTHSKATTAQNSSQHNLNQHSNMFQM